MASVAEQLAANLNFGVFAKATELKRRIWFALGCLIAAFNWLNIRNHEHKPVAPPPMSTDTAAAEG